MPEERLQKVLAAAGIASRRASEELIAAGRVQVNGRTVTELGTKVDPAQAEITVDGRPVSLPTPFVYYKLHKPRGMLSDIGGDLRGRQSVTDLLPANAPRVFPVGRLDLNSEGLVLITDDGDLAHLLTHPRYEHPKTYYVLVASRPPEGVLQNLRTGVDLGEERTAPAEVRVVPALPRGLRLEPGPTSGVWLEIILREGKKRQIRHMTAAVGYPTLRLIRWAIGPLVLGDLAPGTAVPLTRREVSSLRTWVRQPLGRRQAPKAPGRKGPPRRAAGAPSARPTKPRRGGASRRPHRPR